MSKVYSEDQLIQRSAAELLSYCTFASTLLLPFYSPINKKGQAQ